MNLMETIDFYSPDDHKGQVIEEANKRRENLVIERLRDKGIFLDLKVEQRRRFKSLTSERKGNKETIYYNDGSENGLRVITFESEFYCEPSDGEMKAGFIEKYY